MGEESPWTKKGQELSVPGHSPRESLGLPGSLRKWEQGEGQDSGDRKVTENYQVRREMETQTLGLPAGYQALRGAVAPESGWEEP